MTGVLVLVIFSQLSISIAAPLMMMPMQHQISMQQMQSLMAQQQQLLQYQQQQLQAMQMPYQMNTNSPQFIPIMVVPMNVEATNMDVTNQKLTENNENTKKKSDKLELVNEDDDEDSTVVDAEPLSMESQHRNIFFLMPRNVDMSQARFSIGQWIESIPWLPFEINVPDTIAWAWNGIGSIIGGIGQANPFRPFSQQMTSATTQQASTKFQKKQKGLMPMPVLFMPMHFGPTIRP